MKKKTSAKKANFSKESEILVIGAGAIGGITAGLLKRAGYVVEVIAKHPGYCEKIEKEGLHIFGIRGDHRIRLQAYPTLAHTKKKYDIVFVAVKTYDLDSLKKDLPKLLYENSAVVSLQNGLVAEKLAAIVGKERTIPAVVGWGATMHEPGELEMTSEGEFVIGCLANYEHEALPFLQELLNHILPTQITTNIMGALYSKLIINACITSLGALTGLYLGQLLSRRKVRNIFIEIMREAMAVAEKAGIKVETYAGKINYYRWLKGDNFWANFRRHLLIQLIGFKYRRLKSSSLQSLERKKPTEIDDLNGAIVKLGKKHKVPTPINEAIVRMIHEIEKGKRQITPENLNEGVFDRFE
ncbi:MAG: 2-dehydropantoate 2-reductase [Leptospiraceae bacterium]|nr:2-dehydropantoate 2-reductase [Leptospiraceae bacterium]MDW8307523.1 2-dehydropantoate 2-reductase [Leptospiraceae bacterium]